MLLSSSTSLSHCESKDALLHTSLVKSGVQNHLLSKIVECEFLVLDGVQVHILQGERFHVMSNFTYYIYFLLYMSLCGYIFF